jgi:excisionase family DNA binding protein
MNPITQNIVRMLCEGLSISEIAARVDISPRQLRRRVGVATEEGEAALLNVLHTLQASSDEDNVLPWSSGVIDSIQGCAERAEKFLTPQEAATYLGGLNARTVTRWAREGYLPSYPVGEGKRRLWRFLQTDLEGWMLARRQGGQNAA